MDVLGLLAALALLIWLTIRGANLLVAAPLCALLVAVLGGIPVWSAETGTTSYATSYMAGFTSFLSSWFFMFLLGSIFGKLMEDCGAAEKISEWIMHKIGFGRAALAVVTACAVMTYGGVSVFVVAFTTFPIALSLFKQANLPRRFIPAAMGFGSATFTMTSAGSPEIQNWIPIKYLGTSPYAGWEVSIPVAIFMALFGYWLLVRMLKKAQANGECFDERAGDPHPDERDLPHILCAVLPLAAVLVVSFLFHDTLKQFALVIALLAGCLLAWGLNINRFNSVSNALGSGAYGALIALGNTCAVVGFGAVAKASPAFTTALEFIYAIPGDGLLSASVAIIIIAAITGSASGGQSIALPELGPHYLQVGVDPEALHRVVAISSGALDSLPHNGYVVTTIRAICGETHKSAYGPLGVLTVIVPLLGTVMALTLYGLFF